MAAIIIEGILMDYFNRGPPKIAWILCKVFIVSTAEQANLNFLPIFTIEEQMTQFVTTKIE